MATLLDGLRQQYRDGLMSARWVIVDESGEVWPLRDANGRANKVLHEREHLARRMADRIGAGVVDLSEGA